MTALLLFALLLQTPRDVAAGRVAAAGSAAIGGVVTTGAAGATRPVRRAVVSIAGTDIAGAHQAVTDETGHFVFEGLRPGRFTLTVDKPGHPRTYVGSRRPGLPPATPIVVADGQRLLDLAIDIPKGAVIDGTVRDENGNPLASAQVTVSRVVTVMGQPQFVSVSADRGASWKVTDDRGHYRIFGLPPGEYVVRATDTGRGFPAAVLTESEFKAAEMQAQTGRLPPPRQSVIGPAVERGSVYFPGVADPLSAEVLTLGAGEERLGVDIVNAPVRAFRIEYTAIGPSGRPIRLASIGLASVSRQSMFTSPGGVRVDAAGHGVISRIPPGRYLFFGRGVDSEDADSPQLFLATEVDVNGADANVTLQFLPGQRVSGRLEASGGRPLAFDRGARVQLNAASAITGVSAATPTASVRPDGAFTFANVPPGPYRIEVGGVSGWSPIAANYQGRDTLDASLDVPSGADVDGLVVSLADRQTEISGRVIDSAGRPAVELTVLVFPQDRSLWTSPRRFSGVVPVGSDGSYRVAGLPPGDYFLGVVTDADALQVTDPMFLEQLMTGAMSVALAEGQTLRQDVRIGNPIPITRPGCAFRGARPFLVP